MLRRARRPSARSHRLAPATAFSSSRLKPRSIASLAGLEQLEQTGSGLVLSGLKIDSLAPLAKLRFDRSPGGSRFSLLNCDQLESLEGLALDDQAPASLHVVGNERLTTLAPLRYRPGLEGLEVRLVDNPGLIELDAFDGMTEIGRLLLQGMPLADMAAFASLRKVALLSLIGNAALVDASALAGLESLRGLMVTENAALRELPDLPQVEDLVSFAIEANPELVRAPAFPRVTGNFDGWPTEIVLGNNAKLESFDAFPALQVSGGVYIADNANLERASFDELASIGRGGGYTRASGSMTVRGNPHLTELRVEQLTTIDASLLVADNLALPSASIEPLRGIAREVTAIANNGTP